MTSSEGRAESVEFNAARGWLEKFMRRNNLSLRRKTSFAQEYPDKLIAKLLSYIIHVLYHSSHYVIVLYHMPHVTI